MRCLSWRSIINACSSLQRRTTRRTVDAGSLVEGSVLYCFRGPYRLLSVSQSLWLKKKSFQTFLIFFKNNSHREKNPAMAHWSGFFS